MKYTKEQLEDMRQLLAESEFEGLTDGDLINVILEGCIGWVNFPDEEVIDTFENVFGDDYFEVVDEKDHKNGLYGEEV